MKKIIILFSILGIPKTQAQTLKPIEADRPDQTETPAIVPSGMFQVEIGFTYQKKSSEYKVFSLPSLLWKYGVNENFELRLITEFNYEKFYKETQSGFSSVLIGFKAKLSDEKGIVPKTSFIAHISLPNVASTKYKNNFIAPEFRFAMQHTLSDKFALSYNLGFEWDGATPASSFVYTMTTGYSINQKLGCYAEIFGHAPQNQTAYHNLDGGLTYLINNNFMLDLSSGVRITDNAPDHYLSLGCSFRI